MTGISFTHISRFTVVLSVYNITQYYNISIYCTIYEMLHHVQVIYAYSHKHCTTFDKLIQEHRILHIIQKATSVSHTTSASPSCPSGPPISPYMPQHLRESQFAQEWGRLDSSCLESSCHLPVTDGGGGSP